MGQSISSIQHTTGVDGEQILLGEMLKCKREAYIEKLKRTKNLTDEINREVHGGKTVNRVTDVRIVDNDEDDHDKQIRTCLYEFILAAQGGDVPKSAAVYGAEKLLSVGLVDACFLADPGQGREKKGFVVLFLNYAFVRVDYLIYSYTATDTLKGACYVADIGVLPLDKLRFDEIEYLLEQSLDAEYKQSK